MPYIQQPRSDAERLNWLRRMADTGGQDTLAGRAYLPQPLLTEIAALAAAIGGAITAADETLAGRIKETAERQTALARLQTYVRDYWQGLTRRTAREGHDVRVLRLHGLAAEGQLPNSNRAEDWLLWAERIVAGDAAAVSDGFPPMCNPTAAEVQAVLDEARVEAADVAQADRSYDEAQAAQAELRTQADDLIDQAIGYLQLALRKLDAPSQRRVMRTYGVVFHTYTGEVLPEDEVLPEEQI